MTRVKVSLESTLRAESKSQVRENTAELRVEYAAKLRVPGLCVRKSEAQVVQTVGEARGEKALIAQVLHCPHVRL